MNTRNVINKYGFVLTCVGFFVYYSTTVDWKYVNCGMTWMYEIPEYVKVRLPTNIEKKYPKYSLFIYGEGMYARYLKSMNGKYKLDGIPVVFVHGNAGRYKQVRSPASVSLRKSESRAHHFNYFSVDYEEELSALYGPFLHQQTVYLHHAINRILKCYAHIKVNKPKYVIAIGHSMGGLVIRGLLSMPWSKDMSSISTIVTLASPHRSPPITLDEYTHKYYSRVNAYWAKEANEALRNITLLSLGGGTRDYFVRSDLCHLDSISSNRFHMSALTRSISYVWLSTDHQCIVWCNELVRALTRAFFNTIDSKTDQINKNQTIRAGIYSNMFCDKNIDPSEVDTPVDFHQLDIGDNITSYVSKVEENLILSLKDVTSVNIWARSSQAQWIYLCQKQLNICKSVDYVTLPSIKKNSKFVSLQNKEIILLKLRAKENILIQKASSPFIVVVPFFQPITYNQYFEERFYSNINLRSFTESWQVFKITFNGVLDGDFAIKLYVPWSNENEMFTINNATRVLKLKIFSEKPTNWNGGELQLHLWKQSFSDIKITITPLHSESFAQLLRYNIELLLRYILVFGIIRALVNNNRLLLSNKVCIVLVLLVLFAKASIWLLLGNGLVEFLTMRLLLPQICLVSFAVLVSDGVLIALTIVHKIIRLLLFPLLFILRKLYSAVDCSTWYVKTFVVLFIAMWIQFKIPASVSLLVLLFVDIIRIDAIENIEIKAAKKSVLLTIVPTLLVFSIAPTIVCVKDKLEGFPHSYRSFQNLIVFCIVYCLYVINNVWLSFCPDVTSGSFLAILIRFILGIISFLSLFSEYLMFYNLTYIVASYLILSLLEGSK